MRNELSIFPCKFIAFHLVLLQFWYHFFAIFLDCSIFPFSSFAIVSNSDNDMESNKKSSKESKSNSFGYYKDERDITIILKTIKSSIF